MNYSCLIIASMCMAVPSVRAQPRNAHVKLAEPGKGSRSRIYQDFTTPASGTTHVSFRYRLVQDAGKRKADTPPDAFSAFLVNQGTNTNAVDDVDALPSAMSPAFFCADSDGKIHGSDSTSYPVTVAEADDIGWRTVTLDISGLNSIAVRLEYGLAAADNGTTTHAEVDGELVCVFVDAFERTDNGTLGNNWLEVTEGGPTHGRALIESNSVFMYGGAAGTDGRAWIAQEGVSIAGLRDVYLAIRWRVIDNGNGGFDNLFIDWNCCGNPWWSWTASDPPEQAKPGELQRVEIVGTQEVWTFESFVIPETEAQCPSPSYCPETPPPACPACLDLAECANPDCIGIRIPTQASQSYEGARIDEVMVCGTPE